MISTIALMRPHSRRAVMVVLGLGAVAGCSIVAASSQSAAKIEPAVQEQVTSRNARQTQPITEPDQPPTTATEITRPSQQSGFAQNEIARLAQDRTQILPRSSTAPRPLSAASSAIPLTQNRVSQAGSVARTPAHPPARPAQAALKKPGPRLLVAEAGK